MALNNKIKKIIHIDMDCFFAAVEQRDHPHLKGKPLAVGGRSQDRSVISTANYEARKYGVRSALPTKTALKLCPHLVLMPHRFHVYKQESQIIQSIFKEYTDIIQPLSLDEAFLDVSNSKHSNGSATLIAQEIRKKIYDQTQLTASAGIAPNKFLAKIASDWNKPNGQFLITPEMIDSFIKPLPISKIPGVGKVTTQKLHDLGIKTCLDLQNFERHELKAILGKFGVRLYELARGIDNKEVKTDQERKSFSVEHTYPKDLNTEQECLEKIDTLFEELNERLHRKNYKRDQIKGVFIKIKFFDFTTTTVSLNNPTLEIKRFKELVKKGYLREEKPVRLLGLGVHFIHKQSHSHLTQLELPLKLSNT